MALVNFLKFNNDMGAIISDQEYWNVFFRKRLHNDSLHTLVPIRIADEINLQAVYGGVGYPSIHKEVVNKTIDFIEKEFKENPGNLKRVKDVARVAFDFLQKAIRRRIDQKMKFYFGFTTDDLNRGYYFVNGEKIQINTKLIKEEARKLASRDQKDTLLKAVFDTKATVFGFDEDGITGYYLGSENSILGYVHEGFEAIGSGKYASGLVFGSDFKAKTLMMRKAGYDPPEGMLELIESAYLAGEHFKEVGGVFNIVVLNKNEKSEKQVIDIKDNQAVLAKEIVKAYKSDFIKRDKAIDLINKLVFGGEDWKKVEKELFDSCSNKKMIDFLFRGYKTAEIKEIFGL